MKDNALDSYQIKNRNTSSNILAHQIQGGTGVAGSTNLTGSLSTDGRLTSIANANQQNKRNIELSPIVMGNNNKGPNHQHLHLQASQSHLNTDHQRQSLSQLAVTNKSRIQLKHMNNQIVSQQNKINTSSSLQINPEQPSNQQQQQFPNVMNVNNVQSGTTKQKDQQNSSSIVNNKVDTPKQYGGQGTNQMSRNQSNNVQNGSQTVNGTSTQQNQNGNSSLVLPKIRINKTRNLQQPSSNYNLKMHPQSYNNDMQVNSKEAAEQRQKYFDSDLGTLKLGGNDKSGSNQRYLKVQYSINANQSKNQMQDSLAPTSTNAQKNKNSPPGSSGGNNQKLVGGNQQSQTKNQMSNQQNKSRSFSRERLSSDPKATYSKGLLPQTNSNAQGLVSGLAYNGLTSNSINGGARSGSTNPMGSMHNLRYQKNYSNNAKDMMQPAQSYNLNQGNGQQSRNYSNDMNNNNSTGQGKNYQQPDKNAATSSSNSLQVAGNNQLALNTLNTSSTASSSNTLQPGSQQLNKKKKQQQFDKNLKHINNQIKTMQVIQQQPQQTQKFIPPSEIKLNLGSMLPYFQSSKISTKNFGTVKTFSANTNTGLVRKANEDRIAIILNVIQPELKQPKVSDKLWPKIQIFAVFDGHGGSKCAEYLKDNLHLNIIMDQNFPYDIKTAIRNGCQKTEHDFLNIQIRDYQNSLKHTSYSNSPKRNGNGSPMNQGQMLPYNKSGSCAIMVMVVNDDVYTINVGDSRAIACQYREQIEEYSSKILQLSQDHKPSDEQEFERIQKAGGYIYQTQTVMKNGMPTNQLQQVTIPTCPTEEVDPDNPYVGPYRVFPGRLSVCRTFGDVEAKYADLGGLEGVVTHEPQIIYNKDGVNNYHFIVIGSDGIFDKLTNQHISDIVWAVAYHYRANKSVNVHQICGLAVDEILHAAARGKSMDNISVVMITFQPFLDFIDSMRNPSKIQAQKFLRKDFNSINNSALDTHNQGTNNQLSPKVKSMTQDTSSAPTQKVATNLMLRQSTSQKLQQNGQDLASNGTSSIVGGHGNQQLVLKNYKLKQSIGQTGNPQQMIDRSNKELLDAKSLGANVKMTSQLNQSLNQKKNPTDLVNSQDPYKNIQSTTAAAANNNNKQSQQQQNTS